MHTLILGAHNNIGLACPLNHWDSMNYKKNHYVPEFYLRSFAIIHAGDRNPMLWVYDKEGKKPHKQSPKDTAAINDLYKASHSGLPPEALEVAFSKQESFVSPILSKWQEPEAIPKIAEVKDVAYFLALLYLRNPKTAKFFGAISETLLVERAKALAHNSAQFDKFWETLIAKGTTPLKGLTKEQFRKMVLKFDDHFIVKINSNYATFSPLAHADPVCNELTKMYWCLCSAPKDWDFITSDSPIVVRFRKGDGIAFGGGFGHPTAQVTFPISPRVCLYLSRNNWWKAVNVTPTFVKNANRRTAFNAERYIFASRMNDGIEKLVKKNAGTRHLPRIDKEEVIDNIRKRRRQFQYVPSESD